MVMTNAQLKQKAIQEAYGEHWEKVKCHVDEDGYLHHPNGGEVTFDPFIGFMEEHPTKDVFRPKSLTGIDTNNGWTRIENDGSNLPEGDIQTYNVGRMENEGFKIFYGIEVRANYIRQGHELNDITHYRPVVELPKPIY